MAVITIESLINAAISVYSIYLTPSFLRMHRMCRALQASGPCPGYGRWVVEQLTGTQPRECIRRGRKKLTNERGREGERQRDRDRETNRGRGGEREGERGRKKQNGAPQWQGFFSLVKKYQEPMLYIVK